jgi:hypothetical protein
MREGRGHRLAVNIEDAAREGSARDMIPA